MGVFIHDLYDIFPDKICFKNGGNEAIFVRYCMIPKRINKKMHWCILF